MPQRWLGAPRLGKRLRERPQRIDCYFDCSWRQRVGRGESPRQQSQSHWLLYREPFLKYHQTVKRSGTSQSPYPLEGSTFRGRCSMR